ncbi:MAG TPA: hypothetical protein VD770_01490, partial [Coxiellaceae bacterium]|nr:hypothetical protein [Coxiellaceae bacterium]
MRQPSDSFILLLALSLASLPILAARSLRAADLPLESLCLEPGAFNLVFNITDYYLQYVADEL